MIAVVLEGGLVQSIVSDEPALIGRSVLMIDYDTDGTDEEDLVAVPQGEGRHSWAAYTHFAVIEAPRIDLPKAWKRTEARDA